MNDYLFWKERIKTILLMDKESTDFINYILDWFDGMKLKKEIQLLKKYHPRMIEQSDEYIESFIMNARHSDTSLPEKDFSRQIFDSAFFLYRPFIKKEFQQNTSY